MRTAMTRTAPVLATVILLACCGPALAVPDPAESSAEWGALICDGIGDKVVVCPGGDAFPIHVAVVDELGQPHVGGVIDVVYDSPCVICLCPPMPVTTDVNGEAIVDVYAGLVRAFTTDCCVVTTTVTCDGVTIPWVYGGETDTREWISPDLNGDCVVDELDQGLFEGHMGGTACICDYNCDGWVNVLDVAWFTPHFQHGCPVSPVETSRWGLIKALYR